MSRPVARRLASRPVCRPIADFTNQAAPEQQHTDHENRTNQNWDGENEVWRAQEDSNLCPKIRSMYVPLDFALLASIACAHRLVARVGCSLIPAGMGHRGVVLVTGMVPFSSEEKCHVDQAQARPTRCPSS